MARYQVVKGSVSPYNFWLYLFANDLVACVSYACKEVALNISGQNSDAFGTSARIPRNAVTPGGLAAGNFSQSVIAPHANAYARHFMARDGKTVRMDLGNLIEQMAYDRLRTYYSDWVEGYHYLYQTSAVRLPRFPINYVGAISTARPDFRYEFYSGKANGDEAVFDITTPNQVGHLLTKSIGNTTIANHPKIPVAVEIIWENSDMYNANY